MAGVRAGKITDIKLDKRTKHALIGFKIDKNGFGSLRSDAFCESRPQSLIGEYFVDCQPGTAKQELKPGAVIPVSRTASTVAPDLVNDILRRPYRERLSLIIGSLGAGVAGNAENLNAAIRRASPALRETDKVLATLGAQNKILGDLTVNADRSSATSPPTARTSGASSARPRTPPRPRPSAAATSPPASTSCRASSSSCSRP